MVSRSQEVSTDSEQILHDTVNRREPLELSGRLETPHLALTLSGGVGAGLHGFGLSEDADPLASSTAAGAQFPREFEGAPEVQDEISRRKLARVRTSPRGGIVKLPTSARFSPSALSARVSVSRHT